MGITPSVHTACRATVEPNSQSDLPSTQAVCAGVPKLRSRRLLVPLQQSFRALCVLFIYTRGPQYLPLIRVFWEGQGKWYRKAGEILGYDLAAARKAWLNEASNPQERKERGKSDYLESEDGLGRVVDFPSLRHGFITYLVTANVPPKVA